MEKINCHKCGKEIDAGSKHCSSCSAKAEKAKKEKKRLSIKDFFTNKTNLFVGAIMILVIVLFFLLNSGKPEVVDIDMKFSIYPGEYQRAVVLAVDFEKPLDDKDIKLIRLLSKSAAKYNAPITFFLTAQEGTGYEDFITGYPSLAFNLTGISNVDFETSGYINQPYTEIPYKYQERLIRQSKLAFKDQGINVKGFFPPILQANYDTILAAENNNVEFILLSLGNTTEPLHPDSLVGGKMNIMIYPVYQEEKLKKEGVFVLLLNKEAIQDQMSFENFLASLRGEDIFFSTARELNDYIRKTEAMSAELTTDYKEMHSYISLNKLTNNTKVDFKTELKPLNITSKMVNRTVGHIEKEEGFFILLNEDDRNLEIIWEKIK